jgi:hypothetical protein
LYDGLRAARWRAVNYSRHQSSARRHDIWVPAVSRAFRPPRRRQQLPQRQPVLVPAISAVRLSSLFANSGAEAVPDLVAPDCYPHKAKESPDCLCRGFQGGVSSAKGSRCPGRPDTISRQKSRKARIATARDDIDAPERSSRHPQNSNVSVLMYQCLCNDCRFCADMVVETQIARTPYPAGPAYRSLLLRLDHAHRSQQARRKPTKREQFETTSTKLAKATSHIEDC